MDLRDFEYSGLIGEGSFAIVKRYRHRTTGERIAVKQLSESTKDSPEYQARLKRGIKLLQDLRNASGVIDLIGHSPNLDGPGVWYAMPVATMNLHKFIKNHNSTLEEQDRTDIFGRILRAIEAAHEHGILHRDISPSNILLLDTDDLGSLVVCDFGLGRDVESVSNRTRSSAANYGHAFYVAPEQREGLKQATVRSDIFSLGKLLNFVMTGKDPDHHHQCPYSAVIRRATHQDPEERYPTTTHLADHFRQLVAVRTAPAPTGSILGIVLDENVTRPQWDKLHAALVDPRYDGLPYYGYLQPVIDFLTTDDRLEQYFSTIGPESARFARELANQIRECVRTVGWPFSATTTFGNFLHRIYSATSDPDTRAICIVELWNLGIGGDQWGPKDILLDILTSGSMAEAEVMALVDHILQDNMTSDEERLFDSAIPAPIRNAIRHSTARRNQE